MSDAGYHVVASMTAPAQALTPAQQLVDLMGQFDRALQLLRFGMERTPGSPRVKSLM
jgi:hypothetical protein